MRVVLHRLWTSLAAFYEAFSAKVARELARRTEYVYTPEHGSLLNRAEASADRHFRTEDAHIWPVSSTCKRKGHGRLTPIGPPKYRLTRDYPFDNLPILDQR